MGESVNLRTAIRLADSNSPRAKFVGTPPAAFFTFPTENPRSHWLPLARRSARRRRRRGTHAASRPSRHTQRAIVVEVRRKRFNPPKSMPQDDAGSPIVDARRGLYSSRVFADGSPHASPDVRRVLYPAQSTPQASPGGGAGAGGTPSVQANSFF